MTGAVTRIRIGLLLLAVAALPASARAQGGFLDFMEQWSGPGPYNYGVAFDVRLGCIFIGDHNMDELRIARAKRVARDMARGVQQAVAEERQKQILPKEERLFGSWFHADPDPVRTRKDGQPMTTRPCTTRSKDVQAFFEAHFAHASTDVRPLFSDRPNEFVGHTNSYILQGLMMRTFLDPAIAIGLGGGIMWFGGDNLDRSPVRPVLTPLAVDITPLRLFAPHWGRWSQILVFHFQQNAFIRAINAQDFNSRSTSTYESHAELFRSFGVSFDLLPLFMER